LSPEEAARHGRKGIVGARTKNEIGIHAVRGGTIVGKHDVIFAGPREVITLSHEAEDRAAFALGSLRAAEWIIGKAPGLYDMQDVLGLRQR
jgi:4-hydroxy-tetrahydrodipicolinate reductase